MATTFVRLGAPRLIAACLTGAFLACSPEPPVPTSDTFGNLDVHREIARLAAERGIEITSSSGGSCGHASHASRGIASTLADCVGSFYLRDSASIGPLARAFNQFMFQATAFNPEQRRGVRAPPMQDAGQWDALTSMLDDTFLDGRSWKEGGKRIDRVVHLAFIPQRRDDRGYRFTYVVTLASFETAYRVD